MFGGENGMIEGWDPRTKIQVSIKDITRDLAISMRSINEPDCEISSIKFGNDGITLAVGTSTGHCLLYDIRSSLPIHVKDHQYGYPIKKIQFQDKKIITSDKKIVKVWEASENTGKIFASIEPPADINDVTLVPNSGLFLFACDQQKMTSYFIPELGPAPKWCAFLDNLTVY